MKIVLLVLSGDPDQGRAWLQKSYPGAVIDRISRDQLGSQMPLRRVGALRSLHPDIFAVATERLVWQSGQNALLLFGVLAGARRVVLFDASGNSREETAAAILARTAFRFAAESAASSLAIVRSYSGLKKLERAVKSRANSFSPKPAGKDSEALRMAYLRSTPGAGTQAGGAATHINGFVNAATELGAEIRIVSNDYIAGVCLTNLT